MWWYRRRPDEAEDVAGLSVTLNQPCPARTEPLSPPQTDAERWLEVHARRQYDDDQDV